MPVKPPRSGGSQVDVDVHIQSNRKSDANATPNTNPGRNGADPLSLGVDPKPRNRAFVDDADLDAILPALTVSVPSPPLPAPVLPVISRPLENYWIKSAAELPKANGEGFRLYRNRQYVDVPDGGVVLVAMEADTGLYRARFASELIPSGPLLLRDTDSLASAQRFQRTHRSAERCQSEQLAHRAGLQWRRTWQRWAVSP